MLYTQQFLIPASGTHRIGTIGGEPYEWLEEKNRDGSIIPGLQQKQVGYMIPPKVGLLKVLSVEDNSNIKLCKVSVTGYSGRPIPSSACPADIYVEFPCSVIVTGPPKTAIIIEAWHIDSVGNSRGASLSALAGLAIPVPLWAKSFDLSTPGVATFKDATATIVGVVTGTVTNFSLPTNAVSVDIVGANVPIIFRQQG
jgi:hypothetical protein